MGLHVTQIIRVVLIATIAIGTAGSILAWRERPEPGAVPLTALLAGQCWWSATLFFRINASGIQSKTFWFSIGWVGIVVIPVAWLFFSLEYTGYNQYVQPRYIALASVIPAITALLSLTNGYHDLLYVSSTLVDRNGTAVIVRTPGVWFWVSAGYTYLLGVLGAIPMLQFVTSDFTTFRGQSLALLLGLFTPWVTNVLFVAGVLPTAGIDPTPVAFSVTGVAYLGALTRFRLFGTSLTPIRQARRSIFDRMQEGAIVLDRHDNIVDMNRRAAEALETEFSEALGRPIQDVIPEFDNIGGDQQDAGSAVFHPDNDDRAYDVSVSGLVDTHDRTIGRIVTLHDISEHLRQQQRLEVLNRVFRHNIRTNTQIIVGHADYLATNNSKSKAETVRENALEIKGISDKIRTVLDMFEQKRTRTQAVQLDALVRDCVSRVQEVYPDVDIAYEPCDSDVYVDVMLEEVYLNVIENAAQHNTNPDPRVCIETELHGDRVETVVSDNGPGIEDVELSLLKHGTENPLRHGSGFGLALIVWGTEVVGGEVSFEKNDPSGLVVTVDVPTISQPDSIRDLSFDTDAVPFSTASSE